jgi:hypothetical protein
MAIARACWEISITAGLVIVISRGDRPPWQSVETYADLCDHDFSELVSANRFAEHIKAALKVLAD